MPAAFNNVSHKKIGFRLQVPCLASPKGCGIFLTLLCGCVAVGYHRIRLRWVVCGNLRRARRGKLCSPVVNSAPTSGVRCRGRRPDGPFLNVAQPSFPAPTPVAEAHLHSARTKPPRGFPFLPKNGRAFARVRAGCGCASAGGCDGKRKAPLG